MARDLALVILVIVALFVLLGQMFPGATVEELPGKIWEGVQGPPEDDQATSTETN
ncbi:hypothetical protein K2Y00_00265 [Patescibacteria group bacterium]|nr:hypothetical protein [Patescibacteria group bacterium]